MCYMCCMCYMSYMCYMCYMCYICYMCYMSIGAICAICAVCLYVLYVPPQIHIKYLIISILFIENTNYEDIYGVIFSIVLFLLVFLLQFSLTGLAFWYLVSAFCPKEWETRQGVNLPVSCPYYVFLTHNLSFSQLHNMFRYCSNTFSWNCSASIRAMIDTFYSHFPLSVMLKLKLY
jgi:hypothetical protein